MKRIEHMQLIGRTRAHVANGIDAGLKREQARAIMRQIVDNVYSNDKGAPAQHLKALEEEHGVDVSFWANDVYHDLMEHRGTLPKPGDFKQH